MRGGGECFGALCNRLNLLGEFHRGELVLPDHPRAAGGADLAGVGGLVIVGGDRQRHEDRRTAHCGQFGHGRCPGAADEQMRIGQPLGHVLKIGAELCRNTMAGIARAHCLDVFGAALLGHLQPCAQRGLAASPAHRAPPGTARPRPGCPPVTSTRSSPSSLNAGNGCSRSARTSGRIGLPTRWTLSACLSAQPLDSRGKRWRLHATRPARNRLTRPSTAFCSWINAGHARARSPPAAPERPDSRQTRPRSRLKAFKQPQRHPPPFQDRSDPVGPLQRVLADPPGGQHVGHQRIPACPATSPRAHR